VNDASASDDFAAEPRDMSGLFDRIGRARSALKQTYAHLNDAQMIEPGADGGWSVKDHLAHLMTWEAGIAALLRHEPRWAAMGLDDETVRQNDEAGVNAIIDRHNKDRALPDVLADFEQTHRDLLAVLEQLTFDDLLKTYSYYQPNEPRVDSGRPILAWIAGDTYEHYEEHEDWVRAVVEHVSGGGQAG
jgi:uncharacterized damage-inducible protein DinB